MGEETGNLKGEKNEVHRKTDDSSSNGEIGGGGQAGFGKDDDKDTCLRKWFSLLVSKVEKDFCRDGKIEWHGKLWKWPKEFVYIPLLPSEEKLSIQLDSLKRFAIKLPAAAAAVIYYVVKMENQASGLKNQEHVELIFETSGYNRKYIWDICRESGKLPWLENGKEDENYEGGRLLNN